MAEPVNIHINIDEFSLMHLLDVLSEEGKEVEKQYNHEGTFLYATVPAKLFLSTTQNERLVRINDVTYSKTLLRIEEKQNE